MTTTDDCPKADIGKASLEILLMSRWREAVRISMECGGRPMRRALTKG